jgi:hypothetical protein
MSDNEEKDTAAVRTQPGQDEIKLTGWFYLSFAGPIDGDERDVFRGGVIVPGHEIIGATCTAHMLKINPGGQVIGMPIPEGFLPDEKYRERLLSKTDIQEFWPDAARVADIEAERCT